MINLIFPEPLTDSLFSSGAKTFISSFPFQIVTFFLNFIICLLYTSELERNMLHEVAEFENVVISTGGGAPCFFDNMDFMNRTLSLIHI